MNIVNSVFFAICAMAWLAPVEGPVIQLTPATQERCLRILRDGLRQGVRGTEFFQAMHAAEALTIVGYGEEVRRELAGLLDSEKDDRRRCGLARELVRAGDVAQAGVMLGILARDDPYAHIHACESLFKCNQIGDGQALRAAVAADTDSIKALMAAAALTRRGEKSALEFIRQKVGVQDGKVARIAAWILGQLGDKSDLPALRLGRDRYDDAETRCYFEHALAALRDPEGIAALKRNLTHKDDGVRAYAATFASDTRDASLQPALEKLLDDPTLEGRIRAAQSLVVLARPANSVSR